jgi:hypothetical protein
MRHLGLIGRVVIAVMVMVGIVSLGTVSPADAVSKYARITIHKAECPANTSGDIFTKCHDNKLEGAKFTVYNPTGHGTSRYTDADGVTSFGPRAGNNRIVESSGDFNTYGKAYVYCSDQNTDEVLFDGPITVNKVTLQTKPGAVIICDWYNLT